MIRHWAETGLSTLRRHIRAILATRPAARAAQPRLTVTQTTNQDGTITVAASIVTPWAYQSEEAYRMLATRDFVNQDALCDSPFCRNRIAMANPDGPTCYPCGRSLKEDA